MNQFQQQLSREEQGAPDRRGNDCCSHWFCETTKYLHHRGIEFLESDDDWKEKYDALQEKLSKELAEKAKDLGNHIQTTVGADTET